MSIAAPFVRLNAHMERHKTYYILLETALIVGVLYFLGAGWLLHAPWLTQHISNFIGSLLLTLVIIGPPAFKQGNIGRIIVAALVVIALNVILEFLNPIKAIDLPYLVWSDFNTPDPIDALFGITGVVTAITSYMVTQRKIREKKASKASRMV